jgi:hypothetical protein
LQRQADPEKGGRARIRIRRVNINLSTYLLPLKDIILHADISKVVKIEIVPRNKRDKENTYKCVIIIRILILYDPT